jgi:hypothetical protein
VVARKGVGLCNFYGLMFWNFSLDRKHCFFLHSWGILISAGVFTFPWVFYVACGRIPLTVGISFH